MQLYYQGKLSMEDYMQATLAPLTGLSVQTVAGWVQRYIRRDILPRVYPAARERLQWHRERGDCISVISATGEHRGADRRTARRRRCAGDRRGNQRRPLHRQHLRHHDLPTGQGDPPATLAGAASAPEIRTQPRLQRLLNDKAMLQFVDSATVINPDSELSALAAEHGWEVCRWER